MATEKIYPKIGVGITTRNRRKVFNKSYSEWLKYLPKNTKLVVVDDASDKPCTAADFRFEEQAGIAAAKNKCFELLDDCDYIFLADDDCYPKVKDWHLPYINSGYNHLSFTFDRTHDGRRNGNTLLKRRDNINIYSNPCGCLLFFTKKCLEVVGGMDTEYGIWGMEHSGISTRIFNAGLTPYKFMDLNGSSELFYACDYYGTVERTVSILTRQKCIAQNTQKYLKEKNSKAFIPYKPQKNTLITTYFTTLIDPQRGKRWEANPYDISGLVNSLNGDNLIVLHDCLKVKNTANVKYVKVKPKVGGNPYFERWIYILRYLKKNDFDFVFCVDATDVELLKSPFKMMNRDRLYVGDEPTTINTEWLQKHHNVSIFADFYRRYANKPLLNAGLLGGEKRLIVEFLSEMVSYIENEDVGYSDMAILNFLLYTKYSKKVFHGRQINTPFKSESYNNVSWFKHK